MIIDEKEDVQPIEVEIIEGDYLSRVWRQIHYDEDYYLETNHWYDNARHPISDAPYYIQERKRRFDERKREMEKKERRQDAVTNIIILVVGLLIISPFIYAAATDQWLAPFIIIGLVVMLFGSVFGNGPGLP